jgi:hypothetical protein
MDGIGGIGGIQSRPVDNIKFPYNKTNQTH